VLGWWFFLGDSSDRWVTKIVFFQFTLALTIQWPAATTTDSCTQPQVTQPLERVGCIIGKFFGVLVHTGESEILLYFVTNYLTYQFNIASSHSPSSLSFPAHTSHIGPKLMDNNENNAAQCCVQFTFTSMSAYPSHTQIQPFQWTQHHHHQFPGPNQSHRT